MGQWGRQHEQVNCCFLETVSVHPTYRATTPSTGMHTRCLFASFVLTSVHAPVSGRWTPLSSVEV